LLRDEASGAALEPSNESNYGAVLDRIAARVPELERAVERENEEARQLALLLESGDRVAAWPRCAPPASAWRRSPSRSFARPRSRRVRGTRARGAPGRGGSRGGDRARRARSGGSRRGADRQCAPRPRRLPGERRADREGARALGDGLGSPVARGDVALRDAALLADQSRFAEALRRSREAGRWFTNAGAGTESLRALLQQSNILRELDRLPEALAVLERAAEAPDIAGEPRLQFAVATNRACYQAELGRFAAAEAGLSAARGLAASLGNPLDAPRVDWVEAVLRGEQGRLGEAENLLRRVRSRYLELDLAHDVALATLELALVVARQGRYAEAHRLALEALPTFEALRVSPEAVAALRLAVGSAREEALRVEVLRSALKRLRR
jgi:tetratricopeptide (TPR) repeat protein